MCQVLTHCGFSGVSPDGNCAYVHWGSFTSNSRSVRWAIWFTWFSEPHKCIQHLAGPVANLPDTPGGPPSNYELGATLLNFSDRANIDELTPYSVYRPCHKSIKCSPNYVRAFPDHIKEVIGPYNLLDHMNEPFHVLLQTDHVDIGLTLLL